LPPFVIQLSVGHAVSASAENAGELGTSARWATAAPDASAVPSAVERTIGNEFCMREPPAIPAPDILHARQDAGGTFAAPGCTGCEPRTGIAYTSNQ
jgi:hypothetical protein